MTRFARFADEVARTIARASCHLMTCYDDAVRTIIELPAAHLEALARVCRRDGISRAEAIRRLLEAQLTKETGDAAGQAFGLWRSRRLDGLAYQERMRREWGTRARRR